MPKYNMTMREFGQLIEEYKEIEELKSEAKRYLDEGKGNLALHCCQRYNSQREVFVNKFTLENQG